MSLPTVSPVADRKTLFQRIIAEVQELLVKGALLPGDVSLQMENSQASLACSYLGSGGP
jgi:hypothetical protein